MSYLLFDDRRPSRELKPYGGPYAITRRSSSPRPPSVILRMLRFAVAFVSASASLLFAAPQQDDFRVPVSRTFAVSYVVRVGPAAGSRKIQICVPIPSTDSVQTISTLRFGGAGKPQILTDSKSGDRYALLTLNPTRLRGPAELRVAFEATRYEPRIDDPMPSDENRATKKLSRYVQADSMSLAVANIAQTLTGNLTDPLEKARSLYEYVVAALNRDPADVHCKSKTISISGPPAACFEPTELFVAMARAAGIPARAQFGWLLPEDQKGGIVGRSHSWAEFFAPGLGWIPVDLSSEEQSFGNAGADRLAFSSDSGICGRATVPSIADDGVNPSVAVDDSPYAHSVDLFFQEMGLVSGAPPKKTLFALNRVPAPGEPFRSTL